MPIIRSHHALETTDMPMMEYVGDKVLMTHVHDVAPVAKMCKDLRKLEGNGFSKDRSMREIARIPELVFFARPELVNPDGRINKAELRKFLRSPDGEMFRIVDKGI